MLAVVGNASAAWKEKVLYSFQGGNDDGAVPAGGVVFDAAGSLYTTTTQGFGFCPPAECGSILKLSPSLKKGGTWTETALHVFAGQSHEDGNTPAGGVTIDSLGNLYGTTAYGGTGDCILLGTAVGCGTVYKLSPPKQEGGRWIETILHDFQSGRDGYFPWGDLTFDKSGNLYGATQFGGGKGTTCNGFYGGQCGAVFELSPPKNKGGKWKEKILYAFTGNADGANPNGGLTFDRKGTIYGTAVFGGYQRGICSRGGCGVTFELIPPVKKGGKWQQKVIYKFHGQEGAMPMAGVALKGDGHLYGTVYAGATDGMGAVFALVAPIGGGVPWKETSLYRFKNRNDGTSPQSALITDATGRLWGTALGGDTHRGVVFRLDPPAQKKSWAFRVLYNLKGAPDGNHPTARLTFNATGDLFSTTEWGGTGQSCQGGCGTVFEISP
jgi:hypothetical protein